MVKFCVGLFEMTPERRRITREMLAQAFGDNYTGYILEDKALIESVYYVKELLGCVKPDADLLIIEGELKDLDKYHPYDFTSNFLSNHVWAFWGTSKRMCDWEAKAKAGKLISDLNKLSKLEANQDNYLSETKGIDFIF